MDKETVKALGFINIDFHEINKIIGYDQMVENASHSVFTKNVFKGLFCHKDNSTLILACHWNRGHRIFVGKIDKERRKLKKIINIDFDSDPETIKEILKIITNKYKK